LACLQVSMITKSRAITYVDSKPPALKTKIVTSSCTLGFHLVNGYTSRPGEFEDITFTEYFIKYETDRMTRRSTTPIIKDNLGYYVYRNKKITRFTIALRPQHKTKLCLRMPYSRLFPQFRYLPRFKKNICPQKPD
jgi:hypothetical protein